MYICPKIQDFKPEIHEAPDFKVEAVEQVTLWIDSAGDVFDSKGGDSEWTGSSSMTCGSCGHRATVRDFWPGGWPSK